MRPTPFRDTFSVRHCYGNNPNTQQVPLKSHKPVMYIMTTDSLHHTF